ncbi:MAG: hypothetical protein WD690_10870 [Vicinamibacterales bacterium]
MKSARAFLACLLAIGVITPASGSQASTAAERSYDAFCQKKDEIERRRAFNAMTREQTMDIARLQIERWRDANRQRLTPEQLGLLEEFIKDGVPGRFLTPAPDGTKATLAALEERLERAFSREDLEVMDEWPYGPCVMKPAVKAPRAATLEAEAQAAFAAYAAGEDLAVERWVGRVNFSTLQRLEDIAARPAPWNRTRAAFLLEIAAAAPTYARGRFLAAGRSMVMARPVPLGQDPVEDRFEVLWHQAALGLLQPGSEVALQQEYLAAVVPRFEEAGRRGVTLETRLPLARASLDAILCCWTPVMGALVREIPRAMRGAATLESALSLFERAAAAPALRAEALIRGAVLLYDAGRYEDALAWFDRVPPYDDPGLTYAHHLTRGRALDLLNRPAAEAAAAYVTAVEGGPIDQRAGIGLASALLRSGRPEEAAVAAAHARRMPDRATNALSQLQRADFRFVPEWLREIRRLRR